MNRLPNVKSIKEGIIKMGESDAKDTMIVFLTYDTQSEVEYVQKVSTDIGIIIGAYRFANSTFVNTRIRVLKCSAQTWERKRKEVDAAKEGGLYSPKIRSRSLKTSESGEADFEIVRHPRTHERMDTNPLSSRREELEEITIIEKLQDSEEQANAANTYPRVERYS